MKKRSWRQGAACLAVSAVAVGVGVTTGVEAVSAKAAAPTRPCTAPRGDFCVEDSLGAEGSVEATSAGPRSSGGSGPQCAPVQLPTEAIPGALVMAVQESIPEPPDDLAAIVAGDSPVQAWTNRCDNGLPFFYWVDPEAGGGSVSEENLALVAYARLVGRLPDPQVAADPPPGATAIINTPTFVEIQNWVEGLHEEVCDPPVCVSVTATPSMSFDPGEPGTAALACEGPGSRYVPGAGPPETQATGACAHAYTMRTGVESRRGQWPGEVTVTWELTWTSTTGGTGGLPTEVRTAELARSVTEVQAVVREVD